MKRPLSTAICITFASIGSMGAFCMPAAQDTATPTPQVDTGETYRKLFVQQYESLNPTIDEYFDKIDLQEAEYQDWHERVDDDKKQKATYGMVIKQHDDLIERTKDAQAEYDQWQAYHEEHKATATPEHQNHQSQEGQQLQQTALKIFSDYGQLKTTMMRLAPLHDM
ncbi:MAG: hypothetical protein K0V04_27540 [Deltaproteobacteria bacterium]|nr:hypothetical protein [Deltaproteobacteria bacterium]